ncbi:hypothetical protein CPC08DRAFT_402132 [Agrocybe pediades]|nr:hypothetical protein CPC08DRAFT_402132 [Agrocybe pediades]
MLFGQRTIGRKSELDCGLARIPWMPSLMIKPSVLFVSPEDKLTACRSFLASLKIVQSPTFHSKVRQFYAVAAILLRNKSSNTLAGGWNVMQVARLLPLGIIVTLHYSTRILEKAR